MATTPGRAWRWLIAVVLAHLVVSIIHGTAHTDANVPLSPAQNLFVLVVVFAGPLLGIALSWWAERPGCWLVAASMAGSLVFGFVNHFVLASPDHVAHVDPRWRTLFGTTAVLLAVTEALGAVLAVRCLSGQAHPPVVEQQTSGDTVDTRATGARRS